MADVQREVVLDIEGMTCASCVNWVEGALRGVATVDVNLANRTATVPSSAPVETDRLIEAEARTGYGARPHEGGLDPAKEYRSYPRRFVAAAMLTVPILVVTAAAMAGSSLSVVLNALRLRYFRGRAPRSRRRCR